MSLQIGQGDLDNALSSGNTVTVARLFQGLAEKQRKEFAPRALEWFSVCSAYSESRSPMFQFFAERDGAPKAVREAAEVIKQIKAGTLTMPKQACDPESMDAVKTAVLACCGFTEVKKVGLPP